MFLKSIEVQGFKSFANKLTFEFDKGITGIVGPNGSGKSNVADAVRWVLGEQSAKQLRGSKMEDVIFSGTENRKALGFAYVAITLDNSDHALAVDYDTVTVSRRVYRSGESEYKINGHTCRLKDIQELFFDTGIGKEGYSIIGQGQIDKILSGKPEDRRELFDEAVGIVKYKRRKQLAEKNLETEQVNLSRVKDILHELEKQIVPLERQSQVAKIYLSYKEDLKQLDTNMYLLSYQALKSESAKLEDEIQIVTDQLNDGKANLDKIKIDYAEKEKQVDEIDIKISGIQEKIRELTVACQKTEGEQAVLNNSVIANEDKKKILQKQVDEHLDRKEHLLEQIDAQEKELMQLQKQMAVLEKSRKDAQREKTDIEESIENKRKYINDKNADMIEYLNEMAVLKGRIERYEALEEQAKLRKSNLDQRLIVLQSQETKEGELVAAFEQEADMITRDLERIRVQQSDLERKQTECQVKLQNETKKFADTEKKYHETAARYQTLKNVTERYDGYAGSVRKVMEKKSEEKGIIGVVADLIQADKKYEVAIETALGGSISNIVTHDEHTAKRMIQYLKQNRLGRATFLPLTSIKGKRADGADKVSGEQGVIGLASDLIQTEAAYRTLVEHLLGRIYVVDHIDHALNLAKKYHYSLRIVTLEGESLNPGGSLSGGAYKNTGNLLGRHREMEELKEQVHTLSKEGLLLKEAIEHAQKEEKRLKELLEKIMQDESALKLRENTVLMRLKQVKDSKEIHEASIIDIQNEYKLIQEQEKELNQYKDEIGHEMTALETKKAEAEQTMERASQELEKILEQEKQFGEVDSDLRIRSSELEQNCGFIQTNIRRERLEVQNLEQTMTQCKYQLNDLDNQNKDIVDALEKLKIDKEKSEQELSVMNAMKDEETTNRLNCMTEHKQFFEKREEITDLINALDKELYRLNAQKVKAEDDRSQLSNYMWDEYGLTYQSSMEWQSDEMMAHGLQKLKRMIAETKSKIKGLGAVNVNALEEYKTVHERLEKLQEQYQDMVEAETKLTGIIESLNTSMKKQFAEQFGKIKIEFDRIFKILFGGGKGTLELSDAENLLETGIVIIAQPPGKKLQNMMQLSGGEKALTAIALLFAIQSLKPSPFCLLDEIEAALDDANVKRFAEYLHKLTKDTQFIVITHRRGTMNAADILYGITMQEKGISTLVSVSLIESDL